MTRRRKRPLGMLRIAALVIGVLTVAMGQTRADPFTPHVATYGVTLQEIRTGEKVVRSGGQITLRLARLCEGWRMNTRLSFTAGLEGGRTLRLLSENGIEESSDGRLLSFASSNTLNDDPTVLTRGAAQIFPNGRGRAIFTSPARREVKLPSGVVFPVAGAQLLVKRLAAGNKRSTRRLFDGSTDLVSKVVERVMENQILLGQPPSGDPGLLDARSWSVAGVWFHPKTSETLQKTTVQIHANGVASRMIIDLGLVVLNARLTDIRRLAPPNCDAKPR